MRSAVARLDRASLPSASHLPCSNFNSSEYSTSSSSMSQLLHTSIIAAEREFLRSVNTFCHTPNTSRTRGSNFGGKLGARGISQSRKRLQLPKSEGQLRSWRRFLDWLIPL